MKNVLNELSKVEQLARQLEPDQKILRQWSESVLQYGLSFVDQLDSSGAYQAHNGETLQFDDIQEGRGNIDQVIQELKEKVDSIGINPASGGHLGYIPGGGLYPAALGDYLAAVTNRYAGIFYANPGAVSMENDMIKWTAEQMGYPSNCGGNLCSGGSIANLIAITTARDKMNIEGERVRDAVVYMTQQVHHCIHKALRIAGLGNTIWRNIPLDASFRMDVERLEKQIQVDRQAGLNPFLVVGSAGTTDVGAVDPLEDLARICSASGCWFHVDGAYGAAFKLLEDKAELFSGMELSDSLVIDPHKGFFLPYGLGIVLIKDKLAMAKSHAYQANYMQDAMNDSDLDFSPADLSPELTKHFRGLRMWMSLKLLGSSALKAGIREKHLLAKYFWHSIQELGFEVGPEPALSVVTYRYPFEEETSNEMNLALMKYVLEDGYNFISSTTIEGDVWLRLAVLSFRTHRDRIDHLMDTLNRGVENLRSRQI